LKPVLVDPEVNTMVDDQMEEGLMLEKETVNTSTEKTKSR
jgi:hypothetical protein